MAILEMRREVSSLGGGQGGTGEKGTVGDKQDWPGQSSRPCAQSSRPCRPERRNFCLTFYRRIYIWVRTQLTPKPQLNRQSERQSLLVLLNFCRPTGVFSIFVRPPVRPSLRPYIHPYIIPSPFCLVVTKLKMLFTHDSSQK